MNNFKQCQSCGIPLSDELLGTNGDESKNNEYCSYCFCKGKFVDEGISMEEKIEKLVKLATEKLNIPKERAQDLANQILPQLKRWK